MHERFTSIAATNRRNGRAGPPVRKCALMLVAAFAFLATGAVAEDTKTGVMDPQAIDTFKRMSQHLKDAKTLSFSTEEMRELADPSGIKQLRGREGVFIVQRPDRFRARILRDDGIVVHAVFDGETLSIAVSGADGSRYASIAAPDGANTIDGILDHLIDEYDIVLQLGDLMYGDLYETHGDSLLSAADLGRKLVGGRPCHHLSLEFAGADAQLWVQDGDDPVPCRWAFTLREEPSEPLFVSQFDSWVTNPHVDTARFQFEAPAGATKVDMKDVLAERTAR